MSSTRGVGIDPGERVQGRRLTLGVLAGWPVFDAEALNPFLGAVLDGFRHAAADHDCNLLVAAGVEQLHGDAGRLGAWPLTGAGSDIVPVGHFNTDALMVVPPIRTAAARRYVDALHEARFPITFFGAQAGTTGVSVDNHAGIAAAFEHLVEHGHERIAFIAGDPSDRADSWDRVQAFRAASSQAGIAIDERLIVPGMHSRLGGSAATERLLECGSAFTAVMASNDQSAIGALDVFARERLRVPDDVAVVGFDDQPSSAAVAPSLTTVAYPLYVAARTLLRLTLQRVRMPTAAPERILVEPKLVTRLSCGCVPGIGTGMLNGLDAAPGPPRCVDTLVDDVLQRLRVDGEPQWNGAELVFACRTATAAFLRVLDTDTEHASFIASLAPLLRYVERVNAHASALQEFVTELRSEMTARLSGEPSARCARAEGLLHAARMSFSDAAHRRDRRHRVEADQLSNLVGRVAVHLNSATTEAQIRDVLASHLDAAGIHEATLVTMADHTTEPEAVDTSAQTVLDAVADHAERRFPGLSDDLARRSDRYDLALVPVASIGAQVGLVVFDATRMGPLGTIARQIGAGLHNVRMHAEVLRLGITDQVTGLRNRAYLDVALEEEVERSRRYGSPMSVLIIDIDRFKAYNDSFGHLAGDVALAAVTKAAESVARDADVLARYGGEEFVMVMTQTGPGGARRLAERIRHAVRELRDLRRRLTVSVGVASLDPSAATGETPHTLLERADRALYRAKQSGRDRVCVAEANDAVRRGTDTDASADA